MTIIKIENNYQIAPQGELLDIPISLENGEGILSVDLTIKFDDDLLQINNISTTDFSSSGTLISNISQTANDGQLGTITLSYFGSNSLSGSGDLFNLAVQSLTNSGVSNLDLMDTGVEINEGEIPVTLDDGQVSIIGNQPTTVINIANDYEIEANESLDIPISLENGEGILSVDLTIKFDDDLLQINNISTTDFSSSGTLISNISQTANDGQLGTITLSYFGSNSLSGSGDLFNLAVQSLSNSGVSNLDLMDTGVEINEGEIPVTLDDGQVTINASNKIMFESDFNKDGKRDLVWRNQATGKNVVWYMDGANRTGFDNLPQVANLDWQIVGTGDANNDQKTDIYWRNQDTGKNVVWYMDGVNRTGFDDLPTVANMDWEIAGIGDADNDSLIDDIYWRNQATGKNVVWYMDGVNRTDFDNLPTVTNTDWEMVGTADGNGDGKTDLYWRNQATGQNVLWYMDGANRTGFDNLPTVTNTDWQIVGIADADGDQKSDIYWRNQVTGKNVVWYMDGINRIGSDVLPPVTNTDWQIFA